MPHNIVKLLREELFITREDLAKKANISYEGLALIERGKRSPHTRTKHKIIKALGYRRSDIDKIFPED
jgi:DNA-binding XRE family transcriptional regulator